MPEAELVVQDIQGVTVVSFSGTSILDESTVISLGRRLYDLVENQDKRKLLLDFTDVKFLSSSMLGVLIRLQKRLAPPRGRMAIVGLRPDLHRVFKITRLDKLFDFYTDDDEAMGSFEIYPKA